MYRSGCVFDDYLDQNIDSKVERTKSRPIPSGRVSSVEALVMAGLLSLVSFVLVLQTNYLTIGLSGMAIVFALDWIPAATVQLKDFARKCPDSRFFSQTGVV